MDFRNGLSRRSILRGAALAPVFWHTKGAFAQALVRTPALTIGPYYPDRLPLDLDNDLLLVNDSITPGIGDIMWVTGRVLDSTGSPVRGAVVEIWQADNNGAYIHTASPLANRDSNFQGYGKFETASDGRYMFRTVKPGLYPGRTRHIHYQIKTPGRGELITQLHFEGEALNSNDGVLNGVTNAAQKASIVRPIESVAGSAIGEKRVSFDIVMGFTPESEPAGSGPVVSTRSGVVNAAGFQSGATPGAWISIHGFRLSTTSRSWTANDIVGGKLPTNLDGVSVTINGRSAYVSYISPTQINVLAPADSLSGTVGVIVTNSNGASASTNVQLQAALPGFFRLTEDYVIATDANGAILAPAGLVSGLTTVPARPQQTIVLWGTGFGPTNPAITPGEVISGATPLANSVKIRIGQSTAQVAFAGMTGAGLYQFNTVVPDLADGDYPVIAEVAGVRTSSIGSLAASLAFFSLLSLFPLVFMLLYGVSFIVSHDVIGGQVLLSFLKGFLPTLGERLAVELQRIGELETVRWVVFLSFAWFGTLVFYELDYALNVVFDSTWKRHPLISTAIAVASQGAMAFLLVLSYVATQTVNFLTDYAPHLWGLDLIALAAHDVFLTYTLPFTMAFLTVGALYRYVPRRRPQWREAMIGSLTFSLLWVAAKLIFVTYNEYATVYTKIYGSLLEVILLLLWIYYSALLFLLGAVIAHALQQRSQAAAAGTFSPASMVSPSAHAGG